MITKEGLKIYKKYNGDVDIWARFGKKSEFKIIDDEIWGLIDGFLQDIELVEKGLASDSFKVSLQKRLNTNCDNIDIQNQLRALALP